MTEAITTAVAGPSTDAARMGRVTLVRHGEPDICRQVRLSAREYVDWWARYETRGLLPGQTPPDCLVATARGAGVMISSIRPRAIETAGAVCDGRAYARDPLFVEAPLPPPRWPGWIRLSPRAWGFISRVWWWFFNHHEGQETRAQAEQRADQAAAVLIELARDGQDVLLVAHGFFNGMIGEALRRQGWRCTQDQGFYYWKARRFERS